MISIHAPARGASVYEAYCDSAEQFQFTPLREGLQKGGVVEWLIEYFNSRPCERGFRSELIQTADSILFQFTPLREGLLDTFVVRLSMMSISIHAPARGAS